MKAAASDARTRAPAPSPNRKRVADEENFGGHQGTITEADSSELGLWVFIGECVLAAVDAIKYVFFECCIDRSQIGWRRSMRIHMMLVNVFLLIVFLYEISFLTPLGKGSSVYKECLQIALPTKETQAMLQEEARLKRKGILNERGGGGTTALGGTALGAAADEGSGAQGGGGFSASCASAKATPKGGGKTAPPPGKGAAGGGGKAAAPVAAGTKGPAAGGGKAAAPVAAGTNGPAPAGGANAPAPATGAAPPTGA
ncbi:unnamed protein product, partial [Amoebophrya sp. A25]|eukprot:GSA25T00006885001.1